MLSCSLSRQALGIPFRMVSLSEKCPEYRQLVMANHGQAVRHMYETLQEQVQATEACFQCRAAGRNKLMCQEHESQEGSTHLLVSGSPCDPFSTQRSKRFVSGDVALHADYAVTMETLIQLYQKKQPRVGIFEQVKGFLMPTAVNDPTTPCSRPARLCSQPCPCVLCERP